MSAEKQQQESNLVDPSEDPPEQSVDPAEIDEVKENSADQVGGFSLSGDGPNKIE
jgi:hypothetical protein